MKVKRATIHAYWLMFIASVITVSIVTSSQLITDRIGLLLDRQASELLAADLLLESHNEFSNEYRQQALRDGLQTSLSTSLRSAIFVDDNPRLIELKAVEASYPLRGKLETAEEMTGVRQVTTDIPLRGQVWVDSKLAPLVGNQLQLGEQHFEARRLITY
jgi:putative ABC transport system permease protein